MTWRSISVSGTVSLTNGQLVTFALLSLSAADGSKTRVGVVPDVTLGGNKALTSLLVSPIYAVCTPKYIFYHGFCRMYTSTATHSH